MADDLRAALDAVNRASPFNSLAGIEIVSAEPGRVVLRLEARAELLNHAGALHAGVQSALLDTACGYAAGSVAGAVVTLQLGVNYLSSAKGERFEARAELSRTGKNQLFAEARLFACGDDDERLCASATAVLARVG